MTAEEIKSNCRKIETGLPTQWGLEFIRSIEGQLSDGMWENSRQAEGYWRFFCSGIEDGVVFIYVSKRWDQMMYGSLRPIRNRFIGRSDAWVMKWLARKAYEIGLCEAHDRFQESGFEAKEGNRKESLYFHQKPDGKRFTGGEIHLGRIMLWGRAQSMI